MTNWAILIPGIAAQVASHYYRKYHWRLDDPDANPYLYVHDLPKPTFTDTLSNAISITPPTASTTPFLALPTAASPEPYVVLPNSIFSWTITIFFSLILWSALTLAFWGFYCKLTAPEIPASHAIIPANHQVVHKDALDRIRDDNLENKMKVRHAVGSVKGYGMIARAWEGGFTNMTNDFMNYVTQRNGADSKVEAVIQEHAAEVDKGIRKLNEQWRKTCNSLQKHNEAMNLAAVERISELEAELAEQKLLMSKMRAPRENKSVRNRRRREEAEAAAAGGSAAPVGSPPASSSSS